MFWFILVLIFAAIGYFLYRFDKKFKSKYDDRSAPKSWTLPAADVDAVEVAKFAPDIKSVEPITYTKNSALFSPAEKTFLNVLTNSLSDNYRIFGKVRVADAITVKSNTDRSAWQTAFNKISAKHFDFVVCNKENLGILCAVELDDKSHQREDRVERDKLLENVCRAAKLPLVRFDVSSSYSSQAVRRQVLQSIGINENIPLQQHYARDIVAEENKLSVTSKQPVIKLCPRCSSVMVKRTAKSGTHEGKLFWACSTYPACRGIVSIESAE